MTRIIGIDPGLDGALAVLTEYGVTLVHDLPTIEATKGRRQLDSHEFRDLIIDIGQVDMVVIEDQHAMPQNGTLSAFSMGRTIGRIDGVLTALERPVTYVQPAAWKKLLRCPAKAGKDWSLLTARNLYPHADGWLGRKLDHDRADAILIAHAWLVAQRNGEVAA